MNQHKKLSASSLSLRASQATLTIDKGRAVEFLRFPSGSTGVVEGGEVLTDTPLVQHEVRAPEEAATNRAGGDDSAPVLEDAGEQLWFRNTFGNGSQNLAQGWDWAVATSNWAMRDSTAFAMVGREGSANATFTLYRWICICSGPFCIGGHHCYWLEDWQGIVVPGHWVSIHHTSSDSEYVQWTLEGAGTDTQVSLAATYH